MMLVFSRTRKLFLVIIDNPSANAQVFRKRQERRRQHQEREDVDV